MLMSVFANLHSIREIQTNNLDSHTHFEVICNKRTDVMRFSHPSLSIFAVEFRSGISMSRSWGHSSFTPKSD